jgi:hypothetical protein
VSQTIPKTTNLPSDTAARIEGYASRRKTSVSAAIRELAELGLAADSLHEAHLAALDSAHELFGERLAAVEERLEARITAVSGAGSAELHARIDVLLDRLDRIRDALRAGAGRG